MRDFDYLDYDDVTSYCDVYDCDDCPRMGEDCDGEWDGEWDDDEE